VIFAKALRLAGEVRRLRKQNADLAAQLAAMRISVARWRSRAELLYGMVPDRSLADDLLSDLGRIENLREVR